MTNLNKNTSGFSLMEILVVTLFLALIGTYTWSYLRSTIRAQNRIEEKVNLQQTGVSVLNRLTDDLSQVFIVNSYQKITFFKGGPQTVSFTSLSHDAANPEDRESDQAKITYALETDPDNTETQSQMLTRKEVPYFTDVNEKDEDYTPLKVAGGVSALTFTYSEDGVKFVNEWDSTTSAYLNKVPKLIRIALTIQDEKEVEENFEAQIDLPLTADINFQNTQKAPATNAPGAKPGAPSPQPTSPIQPGAATSVPKTTR